MFAVVTRRFPHDFRRAIITLTFLGGLASTVFIPLSAWLIHALGWRHALWVLAALHLLVCAPLHALQLRGAPPAPAAVAATGARPSPAAYLRSAPFLLIGVFVVGMMGVTAALPPHMISLLRGNGLAEAWVIAIPASIGVIQVLGRLLLYFFEHHFDLHLANRLIPMLIPLGLAALIAGAGHRMGGAAVRAAVRAGQRHDDDRQGHGDRAVRQPRARGVAQRRAGVALGAGARRRALAAGRAVERGGRLPPRACGCCWP